MAAAGRSERPGQGDDPIQVVAVVLRDTAGRVLTVRKRGTERFMLVGGKPDPDEPARAAAVRETREEVGLVLAEADLHDLGVWRGPAANEEGRSIVATVFRVPAPVGSGAVAAAGEIEELRWLDPAGPDGPELAPVLTEHVLPLVRRG